MSSFTNHRIVDEAKLFNHRYNVLYDVLSQYKSDGIVLDDKFMLKIEEHLTEDVLQYRAGRKCA